MHQETWDILNQFYDHHSPLKNLFSGFEWKRKQWTRNWEWFGMAFSWSSKVCRVKISFLLGNVGTFPRNAILMGDKISWRSLLQRTFQVSAGTLPLLLPTSLITHDIVIKLATGVRVTILDWYFQCQGQRPQQRGNPPMHQRWWLEISLGNWNNNYTLSQSFMVAFSKWLLSKLDQG